MGDATAACLVVINGPGDAVDSYATRTLSEFSSGMLLDEGWLQFGRAYPQELAEVIRQAVTEAGLELFAIDLVVPHKANDFSWRQTIKELDLARETYFLDKVLRFSPGYASDVFVNYTTFRQAGRFKGWHYLLATVGLGATFAAMTITH